MAIKVVVPFNKLNIENKENILNSIEFNGSKITVKDISTEQKFNIIMMTIYQSNALGIYNPYLLDINFHLNLFYTYTDVSFTDEDRTNFFDTYDKLNNSGLLQKVIDSIPSKDYEQLQNYVEATIKEASCYDQSIAGYINKVMETFPEKLTELALQLKEYDISSLKELAQNISSNVSDKTE